MDLIERKHSYLLCGQILVLLVVTVIIYWPALDGPLLLDDFYNLAPLNYKGGVTDVETFLNFVFGNGSGLSGRPVSMLSFLINDQYMPTQAWPLKYTNLLFHLISGLLIIWFISRLGKAVNLTYHQSIRLALVVGALWMLHPFNVSTTAYVIQRMTQLMGLFTLCGCITYVLGRTKIDENQMSSGLRTMTFGLVFFGTLAVLSKENGVLLLVYVLVMELTLFCSFNKPKIFNIWLRVFIYFPLALVLGYLVLHWQVSVTGYDTRSFSFQERLLTEPRVLLSYLYHILTFQTVGTGLIHDDFIISDNLVRPWSTIWSILVISFLIISAIKLRKSQKIYSFGVLWFFGGHILESTFIPLEIYFEHRNYLPMLGPLYAGVYYASLGVNKLGVGFLIKRVMTYGIVCTACLMTFFLAKTWQSPDLLYYTWAIEHPGSSRAQRLYASHLLQNGLPYNAMLVLNSAIEKNPTDLSLPMAKLSLHCSHGLDVGINMKDLLKGSKEAKFNDGLHYYLEVLSKQIIDEGCNVGSPEDLNDLFIAVEQIPSVIANHRYAVRIYFLHADLYVYRRELEAALSILDKAYELQPTVDIALRQIVLLASGGLYETALEFIERAKLANQNRGMFRPSRIDELLFLENSLMTKINQKS